MCYFYYRVLDVRSKKLDPGSLRRLSIAEEVVHGPTLLLADEPITGLSTKDASIIMTGAFRELVNQERTVIITLHQVSYHIHTNIYYTYFHI